MKIIVTGCAGFIGANLTEYLLNKGYEVVGIDDFNSFYDPRLKEFNVTEFKDNSNFHLYRVDISDRPSLEKVIIEHADSTAIVHLAAWASVTYSVKNPHIYMISNIIGTNNLAEYAAKYKINNFIFASTSSIYGDSNSTPFTEEMNTDYPSAPYPASKKAGEVLLYTYSLNFDLHVTVFRFFNPLGARIRPDMALPRLIRSAEYGYDFPVYQNPQASSRDYTYIDHMMEAIEYTINNPFKYEIMNLGNSNPVTLTDMIAEVERATGKKVKTVETPLPGQMQITYADITKAKKLVKYNPVTSLQKMVEKYYDWFKQQPEWYKKGEY